MPHKMEKIMSEFKAGELKSGGDKTVKKRQTGNSYWSCYGLQGSR